MIKVVCCRAYAAAQGHELLTAGMVRAVEVAFDFSQDWQELEKTAVFTDGTVTCTVAQSAWEEGARVHVPQEVLIVPGRRVRVGVYGTDADGTVLPTVWAELGVVLPGADPDGGGVNQRVWAQLQAQIGDLNDLLTDTKENLVAAINEVVQTGGGGGGDDDGGDEAVMHSVTWTLSHVVRTGGAESVEDGAALSATLAAEEGYLLGEVFVEMGGVELPDAWDADVATLSIPTVTGDVLVVCAGVADTSPAIVARDKGLGTDGNMADGTGLCVTKVYPFTPDIEAIKASSYYDAENDYATQNGAFGIIKACTPATKFKAAGGSFSGMVWVTKNCLYQDGVFKEFWSNTCIGQDNETQDLSFTRYDTGVLYANGIAFTLTEMDADDSYAYWVRSTSGVMPVGVRAGDVIFAGKNTAYYGLANIDGTPVDGEPVAALSLDADAAQDYAVSSTSLLGSDAAEDTATVYGLASGFAAAVDEAREEWMCAYGGDWRKIPLIVTTDQHGRMNSGLFNMLGRVLSLHDLSKVINLGDTVTDEWWDADAEHPLLRCDALEAWCESVKDIPLSRQLNVFGNHDTWYHNYTDAGNPVGTRYPSSQAQLNQYFRNIYARRGNNNGYFAVTDDAFNVKYVVISGFEYKDGSSALRVSTAQMTWLIEELSRNDGYDVVLVSHVPLHYKTAEMSFPDGAPTSEQEFRVFGIDTDALFAARKNKSSGTVTDSDGVQHSYDFSACETPLLCALHGHTHIDAYNYVGGSLLSYSFDRFDGGTVFFVLLDRAAQKLMIWKVEGSAQSVKRFEVALNAADEA